MYADSTCPHSTRPRFTGQLHYYTHVVTRIDVEEITHKTGSFKKFDVFVNMLRSALVQQQEEGLHLDVLTYADLLSLKSRKSGNGEQNTTPDISLGAGNNKRYLILTYASRFDRQNAVASAAPSASCQASSPSPGWLPL